jgi:predicted esterase
MRQHHISVPRSARYLTLGEFDSDLREGGFVCHGYGELASEFLERFSVLDDGSRLLVAPEGLSRHYTDHDSGRVGASWMTREERVAEIDDYVRYLDLVYSQVMEQLDGDRVSVHVLGFSQGAATAARWISSGAVEVNGLILWGGLVPSELDFDVLRAGLGTAGLVLVRGDRDRIMKLDAMREQQAELSRYGIRVRTIMFDGGHSIDPDVVASIER